MDVPTFGFPGLEDNEYWKTLWRRSGAVSMSSRASAETVDDHPPPSPWEAVVAQWEKTHGISCQYLARNQFDILDDRPHAMGSQICSKFIARIMIAWWRGEVLVSNGEQYWSTVLAEVASQPMIGNRGLDVVRVVGESMAGLGGVFSMESYCAQDREALCQKLSASRPPFAVAATTVPLAGLEK